MAPTTQEKFLNRQTCYRVSTPGVYNARFEVHTVGLVKIQTDWDVTLGSPTQCRICLICSHLWCDGEVTVTS